MSMQSKADHKSKSKAVWGATPAGSAFAEGTEPGRKEFFENVIKKRSVYELPFLHELVPFSSFRGIKVLEVGCGAGYDAYDFCRNGADYTGIDITPENIERTRKHLSFYGYSPIINEGDAEKLQFQDESFDIVFSSGVLHHTPDIEKSFREASRVLKKGGEFWVIVYHKNSVFYWLSVVLVGHILTLGFLKRSLQQRLAMIEYSSSKELPLVNVYTRSLMRKLLENTGFIVESLLVRRLIEEDFPLECFRKVIPRKWLNSIGKRFGWYLIARGRKS